MCCRACLLTFASFLAACMGTEQPTVPFKVVAEAAIPAEAAPTATAWPSGDTCQATLAAAAALPEAERRRLDPAGAQIAVAVIDGGVPVPRDRIQAGVTLDLPIPTGDPTAAPCLLLVERASTARSMPRKRPQARSTSLCLDARR